MSLTRDELLSTYRQYTSMVPRWKFWMAAYEGTESMIELDEVFSKEERESETNFKKRKDEAYGFDYSQAVIDLFVYYLFEKDPDRELESLADDDQWQAFVDDCDLEGSDYDVWLLEQQRYASIYGLVGVLVDKPQGRRDTREEEKDQGIYPYVAAYHPQAILDWKFDRSPISGRPELVYLKLKEEGDPEDRYLIWTTEEWQIWVDKGDSSTPELEDSGTNPLGVIPFVFLYNIKGRKVSGKRLGVSDIRTVARIDASILRNLSHGEEIIKYGAFPMMRKPAKTAMAGEQEEDIVGVTAVLEFDPSHPESKPDWLEAEVKDPIEAVLSWLGKKVTEIYRSVNAGGIHATEMSNQAKSGVALKAEFQLLNAKLAAKATNLEEVERSILYFWLLWQNQSDLYEKCTIERPKEFSVEDLAMDLQNVLTAKAIVRSEKFQIAVEKRTAQRLLEGQPQDVIEDVLDDIEKNRGTALPGIVSDEE